jgi:hypothetical protein
MLEEELRASRLVSTSRAMPGAFTNASLVHVPRPVHEALFRMRRRQPGSGAFG